MVYLDWAATAIPERELQIAALKQAMDSFGNPSSTHAEGRKAQANLEDARARLCRALVSGGQEIGNADDEHQSSLMSHSASRQCVKGVERLVFTGSGTEADQIILLSFLQSSKFRHGVQAPHLILSAIEHPAIYAQTQTLQKLGFEVSFVRPDETGIVDPNRAAQQLKTNTVCVAVMAVNNETGAIQNIVGINDAITQAAKNLGVKKPWFHVDCVQALGKIEIKEILKAASSAAFSAHKIGGPRGVGALWLNEEIKPLAVGGGQEGGTRSGTENLFGALGFAACAEKAARDLGTNQKNAKNLAARLVSGIRAIPGALVLPECRQTIDERYSPWVLSAAFPGLSGEVFARALSDAGFAVSTGSACSHTHKERDFRVLTAMGVPEELAFASIRISMGPKTTIEEIDAFLNDASDLYSKLKT